MECLMSHSGISAVQTNTESLQTPDPYTKMSPHFPTLDGHTKAEADRALLCDFYPEFAELFNDCPDEPSTNFDDAEMHTEMVTKERITSYQTDHKIVNENNHTVPNIAEAENVFMSEWSSESIAAESFHDFSEEAIIDSNIEWHPGMVTTNNITIQKNFNIEQKPEIMTTYKIPILKNSNIDQKLGIMTTHDIPIQKISKLDRKPEIMTVYEIPILKNFNIDQKEEIITTHDIPIVKNSNIDHKQGITTECFNIPILKNSNSEEMQGTVTTCDLPNVNNSNIDRKQGILTTYEIPNLEKCVQYSTINDYYHIFGGDKSKFIINVNFRDVPMKYLIECFNLFICFKLKRTNEMFSNYPVDQGKQFD